MKQVAYNIKHKRGFTLVELLVAMGIFVIVVTIVSSIFIRNLRTQQSIVSLIAVNDSASLALEQMAREMRTGSGFCGGGACPSQEIFFTNAYGDAVRYKLEGETVKRSPDDGATFYPITADNVKVEDLKFIVDGNAFDPVGDNKPTKITIILSVRPKGGNIEAAATNLQTTITSRRGDL